MLGDGGASPDPLTNRNCPSSLSAAPPSRVCRPSGRCVSLCLRSALSMRAGCRGTRGGPERAVQVVGPGVVGAEDRPPGGRSPTPSSSWPRWRQVLANARTRPSVPGQQHPGPADPDRPLGAGAPGRPRGQRRSRTWQSVPVEGEHPRRGVGVAREHAALAERSQGRPRSTGSKGGAVVTSMVGPPSTDSSISTYV